MTDRDATRSTTLCRWKRFEVRREPHKLPDGREISHTYLAHPGAVVILPLTADNQLVLVRQYRPAIRRWLLEFPAGTREAEESILACAKRELAEETSLKADNWQAIGEVLPAPGFCDEVLHGFVARDLASTHGELDEDEVIDVVYMTLSDFERQLKTGHLIDGKTLAFYTRAKALGLIPG